jgi:hypothetical protein
VCQEQVKEQAMGRAEQVKTGRATTQTIMKSRWFKRGFEDVRNGLPFDWRIDKWEYERGRLFGLIAPPSMPLWVCGKLNPKAVTLFDAAYDRRLII